MSQSAPEATLWIFVGFLWRGLLLSLGGGIVVGWAFTYCLLLALTVIDPSGDPFFTPIRFTAPAGGVLGFALGFVLGTVDARKSRRRYAIVGCLMGVGLAAYPIFLISLLALPISSLAGGLVGLALGIPMTLLLAAITRVIYAPPSQGDAYITSLKRISMPIVFVTAYPVLASLVLLEGGTEFHGSTRDHAILMLIIGTMGAVAAWFLVPLLVNWYIDEATPRHDTDGYARDATDDDFVRMT